MSEEKKVVRDKKGFAGIFKSRITWKKKKQKRQTVKASRRANRR